MGAHPLGSSKKVSVWRFTVLDWVCLFECCQRLCLNQIHPFPLVSSRVEMAWQPYLESALATGHVEQMCILDAAGKVQAEGGLNGAQFHVRVFAQLNLLSLRTYQT